MKEREPGLCDVLEPHRSEALEQWRALVFDSYSEEAVRFFRSENDRFKNPVGQSIQRATATILDGVLLERDMDGVPEALETLVRIRAVQDLSPAEAVGFVHQLKRAVRKVLGRASPEGISARAREELEDRIDALALSAFEVYTRCREEVFDIRVRAAHRRAATLLRRYNRETPAGGSGNTERETDRRKKGVHL